MALLRIADLETADESLHAALQEISERYDKWEGDDSAERPPGIHASEVSGCARKAVYTMLGTQKLEKPDAMWLKKFKHGHWVHAGIQKDMRAWARSQNGLMSFKDEVPIDPYNSFVAAQYGIYSSCDGEYILRAHDAQDRLIDIARMGLEIKTASPAEFEKMTSPKEAHVEQVHVYMACLDIPAFWLLYYNKGNENTTSSRGKFYVRFQHDIWNQLATRFDHWLTLVQQVVLPDREEGIGCEFCPYRWTCGPTHTRNRAPRALPEATVLAQRRYSDKRAHP